MNRIDHALVETLVDLIHSAPACHGSGTADAHASLIQRALARTPVDWWPDAGCALKLDLDCEGYRQVLDALWRREVTW